MKRTNSLTKLLSLFITILLVISSIPTVFAEESFIDSGECGANGANVKWSLDSDGVLLFSGEGEITDYTWTNFVPTTPWYEYRWSINKIVVEDGITSIGNSAFYGLSSVESVSLSNDILALGKYAFNGCRALTEIDLPNNLQYIADDCFCFCSSLKKVEIPETVVKMGYSAFYGCSELESVKLSPNLTTLPRAAFYSCSKLTEITIPAKVTIIEFNCFNGCTNLQQIDLPDSLETIEYSSFENCTSLTNIDIPNAVNGIGSTAFKNCSSLKEISIPNGVNEIGRQTFLNCTSLEEIEIPDSVKTISEYAFDGCKNLKSVYLYEGLERIGEGAFYECNSLTNVLIPNSVVSVGKKSIGYYNNLFDEEVVNSEFTLFYNENEAATKYADSNEIKSAKIDIDIDSTQCVYNGESLTPDVTIRINGTTLNQGEDFNVQYRNNVNLGNGNVDICFMGDYEYLRSNISKQFAIGNLSINNCEFEYSDTDCQYHELLPVITISNNNEKLILNEDYVVSYTLGDETWNMPSDTNRYIWEMGILTININGINNCIGEKTITFNVGKYDISNAELWTEWYQNSSSIFELKDFEYDGTSKTQSGFRVCDPNDTIEYYNYEVSYLNNVDIGTATMIIEGKGDYYTGRLEKQFYITAEEIASIEITKLPNRLNYKMNEPIDVSGGEITVTYVNGRIETLPITKDMLDGQLYTGYGSPENVWVSFGTGVAYYQVINAPIYWGDSNNDGSLNIKDATAIQKHLASLSDLDDTGLQAAECDNDGKVTIKDATTIQKRIAGLL